MTLAATATSENGEKLNNAAVITQIVHGNEITHENSRIEE